MKTEFSDMFAASSWLMEPKSLRGLVKRAELATRGEIQAAMAAFHEAERTRERALTLVGDVAVIAMSGPITYRSSWMSMFFGGATIEDMQAQFRMALEDDAVRAIVFRCNTPGGTVEMVPEFADEIFAARGVKPVIALADTMIASAGIWLAAQADSIWVSASSQVGSIGVYTEHEDISGMLEQAGVKITQIAYGDHKLDGSSFLPLTPEAQKDLQGEVNQVGREFDAAMARGRGVPVKVVTASFGQGKVFRGRAVIAAGLADKFGTAGAVMKRFSKGRVTAEGIAPVLAGLDVAPGELFAQDPVPAVPPVVATIPVCTTCSTACECPGATCEPGCGGCAQDCPCFAPAPAVVDTEALRKMGEALLARQADVDLTESTLAIVRL